MVSFVAGLGFETHLLVDPLSSREDRGSSPAKEVSAYIYVSVANKELTFVAILSIPK